MLQSLLNKFNKKELKNMIFIYTFALIFICSERLLEYILPDKNNLLANNFNRGLFHYKSAHTEKITCKRGKGYFLLNGKQSSDEERENLKYCFFTMWSAIHIILYTLLGFFCPSLFLVTLCIGIVFEIIECCTFDCHDILDIIYNSSGFGIGYGLHQLFASAIGLHKVF